MNKSSASDRRDMSQDFAYHREWHLDRRVTLALIFALLIQAGSIVYWAAGVEGRVDQNSDKLVTMKANLKTLTERQNKAAVDAARLDERLISIQTGVTEIKDIMKSLARDGHRLRRRDERQEPQR